MLIPDLNKVLVSKMAPFASDIKDELERKNNQAGPMGAI